ncbi:FepA family TonB-dependent siderophore receptor [Chitinasiproducens palmae]|uniref:FepA family TonB-dependent siderophore receptor n=1 Tax=Chitinasiproducens palmae TaxID=1770053 RepID=UPI002287443A|nr:FepA family TonB-dependent siderophore receptor [Chitinasiproducens palmae]
MRDQGLRARHNADGSFTIEQTSVVDEGSLAEVRVLGTAETELKQSLGASLITRQDIEDRPPANDLAELIRTMPGVNLTGAGSSGAYGNQRQIDLRGMGPENTLVLVDGKPVNSRDSQMMRRSGERDTHGDTNWVPADAVDHIEVIRGPAAARYGSGAAGGVINIVTKKTTDRLSGSLTSYYSVPEDSAEGGTQRLGVNLAGPIGDKLSFRVYGNVAKTDADSPDINAAHALGRGAAGREGMRNKDINGLLRWQLTPDQTLEFDAGFGRQGNIYTGEYPVGPGSNGEALADMPQQGAEVRRTYRRTASLTHTGDWGALGDSRLSFQYEGTTNADCKKGMAGGVEGACQMPMATVASQLRSYFVNGELHTPIRLGGISQVLTSGFEYRYQHLDDPNLVAQPQPDGSRAVETSTSSADAALYLENNIELTRRLILTPGLRFDHLNRFGNNFSPSLNATYDISPQFTLRAGIARAFKAPNLYQSDPYYWYVTRGNGCPVGVSGPCYIQGNPNLRPEISVNKEIGIAWNNFSGWDASLTYFRNDYQNKIAADMYDQTASNQSQYRLFKWNNSGPALIHGLEGNFDVPLLGDKGKTLKWTNNVTWMFSNNNKNTNQPLSIIPKYTLNSAIEWRPIQQLTLLATATLYGRQHSRTLTSKGEAASGAALQSIGSYAIFGVRASYAFRKNYRLGIGVGNLFNRVLYRQSNSSSAGAYTYNEPGRFFYVTLSAGF